MLRELTLRVGVCAPAVKPPLPPPSRVRVQHRVRADFERRRPGGRRTFISKIGLHDRHLITNGRDTPYLPRFYTAHPVPPYSFSWGGEGDVVFRAREKVHGDHYRGVLSSK